MPGSELPILSQPCAIPSQGPITLLGLLVSPVIPKQSPSPASSSSSIHLRLHQELCPGLHYASPPQILLCSLILYSCPQLMSSRLLSPFSHTWTPHIPPFLCRAQGPDWWNYFWQCCYWTEYVHEWVRAKSLQSCPTLCDPMDQSSPGFFVPEDSSGKNTGVSGLPCPPPGDLLDPGIKPASHVSCIDSLALDTVSLCCPLLMAHTVKTLQSRRPRFDLWVGKIPWRREWLPTPVFLPGEFHGQRSLAGYSPWDDKELDTTEQLTLLLSLPAWDIWAHYPSPLLILQNEVLWLFFLVQPCRDHPFRRVNQIQVSIAHQISGGAGPNMWPSSFLTRHWPLKAQARLQGTTSCGDDHEQRQQPHALWLVSLSPLSCGGSKTRLAWSQLHRTERPLVLAAVLALLPVFRSCLGFSGS